MGTGQAPGPLLRLRRGHGLVRSPLRRFTDRVEGWVASTLAALALLTLPLAVTVAAAEYQREGAEARTEAAERSPVSAVLVSDAVARPAPSAQRGAPFTGTAEVRWELPDGRQGSAWLPVSADQRAGDRLPLWVDHAGRATDPPRALDDIRTAAVVIGVDLVLAGWLLLGALWWAARQVLERVNAERWRAEWARTEPGWSRRSWQ